MYWSIYETISLLYSPWIKRNQKADFFRQDIGGVDNRREPKPKLQSNTVEITNVSEEHIEYAKRHAQANREGNQDHQQRDDGKVAIAWKIIGY